MKKIVALLLALLLPLTVLAEGEPAQPTPTPEPAPVEAQPAQLTVSGAATVKLKADQAKLYLGVVHQADTVDKASEENAQTVRLVFASLKGAGVAAADMVTEDYAVTALYTYNHGKLAEQETVSGYQITSSLRIIVRDLSKLGVILEAATNAGANADYRIVFFSTQSQAAVDRALSLAIAEGARKAQLAAQAAGYELGALISIAEKESTYTGMHYTNNVAEGEGETLLPEGLEFTAAVNMTYEIK